MKPKDEAHINELLQQYKVRRIGRFEAGLMNILRGRYEIPENSFTALNKVTSEAVMYLEEGEADDNGSYFIALHEMGHAALEHNKVKGSLTMAQKVEQEIAAWEWALANAKSRPTDSTLLMIMDAVSTYTDHLAEIESPQRVEEGVKARMEISAMTGFTETEEDARTNWAKMSEGFQDFTLGMHRYVMKLDPEKRALLVNRLMGGMRQAKEAMKLAA